MDKDELSNLVLDFDSHSISLFSETIVKSDSKVTVNFVVYDAYGDATDFDLTWISDNGKFDASAYQSSIDESVMADFFDEFDNFIRS